MSKEVETYEFKECPNCGGTERIVKKETEEAIKSGLVNEDAFIPVLQTKALICDPNKLPKIAGVRHQVTALFGYYDVCASCGTLYCVRMEKGKALVDSQMPQPTRPMPPFFGKG